MRLPLALFLVFFAAGAARAQKAPAPVAQAPKVSCKLIPAIWIHDDYAPTVLENHINANCNPGYAISTSFTTGEENLFRRIIVCCVPK